MRFIVIDKKTGKEADDYAIALHEDWAKSLCYCDMDGFAVMQDGYLILIDECGRFEYCPEDRFEVIYCECATCKHHGDEMYCRDCHSDHDSWELP